jgi:predicted kinase
MALPRSMLKYARLGTPHVIMLIGAPASGKSTWILENNRDHTIISTDDLIDAWASEMGLTYSEAWKQGDLKDFERQAKASFHEALAADKNIIIDRTNMSKKIRRKFLVHIPKHYMIFGIVFKADREELDRRLLLRPGKYIPPYVMDDMLNRYEEPTEDEFDEVFV